MNYGNEIGSEQSIMPKLYLKHCKRKDMSTKYDKFTSNTKCSHSRTLRYKKMDGNEMNTYIYSIGRSKNCITFHVESFSTAKLFIPSPNGLFNINYLDHTKIHTQSAFSQ